MKTLVATAEPERPTRPTEFDDAELFFFQEAGPYMDTTAATEIAIERAGAERLGFQAGVIFEWDSYRDDFEVYDSVEMLLGEELIHYEEYPDLASDDYRRVLEADLIIDHIDQVLLSAGE